MADVGNRIEIERVRAGFDAWSKGDWRYVQSRLADDALWEENQTGGFPGLDRVYVGPEGFAKWLTDTREAWDAIESTATEIVEVATPSGPSFVAETHLTTRGRDTIAVDWKLFNVLWTRDAEVITRRRIYFDRDEALAAAAIPSEEIDGGAEA